MIYVCSPCRDFQLEDTVPRDDLGNPFCFGCGREMLPYYTASESTTPTPSDMLKLYEKYSSEQGEGGNDARRVVRLGNTRDTAQDNKD